MSNKDKEVDINNNNLQRTGIINESPEHKPSNVLLLAFIRLIEKKHYPQ
jgi:hypothetical protein